MKRKVDQDTGCPGSFHSSLHPFKQNLGLGQSFPSKHISCLFFTAARLYVQVMLPNAQ
jgi:hypothetical protein